MTPFEWFLLVASVVGVVALTFCSGWDEPKKLPPLVVRISIDTTSFRRAVLKAQDAARSFEASMLASQEAMNLSSDRVRRFADSIRTGDLEAPEGDAAYDESLRHEIAEAERGALP